jgi:hypothetical protein
MKIAYLAAAGVLLLSAPAAAQERIDCRSTKKEDMRTTQMLLARAYDCTEKGFAQTLRLAAGEVEKGYNGEAPDWRRAKAAYEFLVRRYEGRKVNSMGWHDWVGSLGRLSRNYETGRPGSGWPQDLTLARSYQLQLVTGLEAAPDANPDQLALERRRLAELDARLAIQRQRSGRWTGDIAALSKIHYLTVRDDDVGAPHMKAAGFAAVIRHVDYYGPEEYDDFANPAYNFNMTVYTDLLIASGDKGVCLILSNADIADPDQQKVGIWYEHLGNPPFRSDRAPYKGWYKLRLVGGISYRPIEWPLGMAARSLNYEFRPASSPELCPEKF